MSLQPRELEEFMMEELAKNKVATVELLLDSGFDIKSFDYDKLGRLYYKVSLDLYKSFYI